MRLLTIVLSILLFSCNSVEKKPAPAKDAKPPVKQAKVINFDTLPNGQRLLDNRDSGRYLYYREVLGSDTLKGGYITCYGVDDSLYYFYLRHGDTLHLLNKTNRLAGAWSVGTLEKDFPSFFITRIDNGNGPPETYQVFDKKTSKNLLGDNVDAWGFTNANGTLYFLYDNYKATHYSSYTDIKEADSLFLYNIQNGNREGFKLPPGNPNDIYSYHIEKITNNSLVVKRTEDFSEKEKTLKYIR